jgi:hypothetical protein
VFHINAYVSPQAEEVICVGNGMFGGDGGECSVLFPAENLVTLTAKPNENWMFTGWGGDCSGSGACSMAMGADRTVSATFAPLAPVSSSPPAVAQAPTLTHATQTYSRWRKPGAQSHGDHGKRTVPVGTTFSFELDEPASVTLSFIRQVPGLRVGRFCVALARRTEDRHNCTRHLPTGTLTLPAHAGKNYLHFAGTISKRELKPGNYTLVLTASASGKQSPATQLNFTIERG